jgi:hypothetical protein
MDTGNFRQAGKPVLRISLLWGNEMRCSARPPHTYRNGLHRQPKPAGKIFFSEETTGMDFTAEKRKSAIFWRKDAVH